MSQFNDLCECIRSNDIILQHQGVIGIRKIVSAGQNPPIQEIVDAHLVPLLIEMMNQKTYPQLQLEATWIVTNIASGNTKQCESIIDKGGLDIIVKILNENPEGVIDQAVWAIGNISGDCPRFRDLIIAAGGLQPIVRLVEVSDNNVIVRQAAWALSNLCRGSPLPKYELVKTAVPALCKAIKGDVLDD